MILGGFPGGSEIKTSACNAGDLGSIPGLGRSSGGGNGNPLQYYCLENPMDGGAWWATVHRVAESDTTEGLNFSLLFLLFLGLFFLKHICLSYVSCFLLPLYVCSVVWSCPTLCNPIDCSLPGSSVHGVS